MSFYCNKCYINRIFKPLERHSSRKGKEKSELIIIFYIVKKVKLYASHISTALLRFYYSLFILLKFWRNDAAIGGNCPFLVKDKCKEDFGKKCSLSKNFRKRFTLTSLIGKPVRVAAAVSSGTGGAYFFKSPGEASALSEVGGYLDKEMATQSSILES